MTKLFSLRRARLELDRTLRGRAFIARALRGRLQPPEYMALIDQAHRLLLTSGDASLDAAAQSDLARLLQLSGPLATGSEAAALELYSSLLGDDLHLRRAGGLIACALFGTTWTEQAAAALERRYGAATQLISSLGEVGLDAMDELKSKPPRPRDLYALTELTRGAVLGVVTHLEAAWPAATHVVGVRP